jgi:hypothetical protein
MPVEINFGWACEFRFGILAKDSRQNPFVFPDTLKDMLSTNGLGFRELTAGHDMGLQDFRVDRISAVNHVFKEVSSPYSYFDGIPRMFKN